MDVIGDLLARIRNAILANKKEISLPASNLKLEILKVMKNQGYLESFELIDHKGKKDLRLEIKYDQVSGESVIRGLKRISVPGQRIYSKADNLKPVLGGLGIKILSTSQGVMTAKRARKLGVGGEVLCSIW